MQWDALNFFEESSVTVRSLLLKTTGTDIYNRMNGKSLRQEKQAGSYHKSPDGRKECFQLGQWHISCTHLATMFESIQCARRWVQSYAILTPTLRATYYYYCQHFAGIK